MKKRINRKWSRDPLAFKKVFGKFQPFQPDELLGINLPVRLAFQALRDGSAIEDDFHTLAAALNVGLVRSEQFDGLAEQTAREGRDALMRCWERHERTQRWGFDGPGLQAVADALDLHEHMLTVSTPQEMHNAMVAVMNRQTTGQVLTSA